MKKPLAVGAAQEERSLDDVEEQFEHIAPLPGVEGPIKRERRVHEDVIDTNGRSALVGGAMDNQPTAVRTMFITEAAR